jgi:hypothetical protein
MWTPTTHADDVSKDKGEAGNTPVSFPLSKSAGGLVAVDIKDMVGVESKRGLEGPR